ncbi:acetyl/propionyl-CoA carboxylase subunit alpha [Actinospica durhamensis]|uniref:Acetyl/propionyl-CoA carboxylase subunit alpha n=1 Tax=Actinospica durhamensis TaxID=1508375 RepID=A0A941IPW7_9ACTN|nr:biotin carboxylase N-terminal domain-containing protein [Actinospica durhamensis]MBR7837000.1 acetyl/propionyl-CoA carboxylase subunit alpha [Actinospica durhamensis]
MITSLLVANRGEIARRIFRACRQSGIATVAVFSDADAHAPHVREADLAVRLPGTAPADTYLRVDLLVQAAHTAGADAVHPGYGFLSEDAAFARAVLDAGLCWIGPSPEAIADMGSKTRAKALMQAAGVPVFAPLDPAAVTEADLPLLVKAAAGGGGRGMRVVRDLRSLSSDLASARSEAAAAFGSDEVFLEPYVERGRHVEVQVLADTHGTVWTLGERDCSIQRRHQKVIEETPAPGLPDGLRAELTEAAAVAARTIGYAGAGTVEFLLGPDGRFRFLEMNTRLQVEHPVTECVTGLDLVAWQLRIAEGAALAPVPPAPRGHAIEARLYAEDPAHDWRPATGTVHRFDVPVFEAEDSLLRLDSAVEAGSVIGVAYDAMLAKLIAWAPTREAAARLLASALERSRVHGVTTDRDLLVRVLRHPAFLAADVHTAFLGDHGAALLDPSAEDAKDDLSALAAALADAAGRAGTGPSPAAIPSGWRNIRSQPQLKTYQDAHGDVYEVRYSHTREGLRVEDFPDLRLVEAGPDRVVLERSGLRRTFEVCVYAGDPAVYVDSPGRAAALTPVSRFPDRAAQLAPGSLLAPMPGTVVRVAAAEGESVTAGQPLLWLEAMKMEHVVLAPADGVLAKLPARPGDQVAVGAVLAVVEPHPPLAPPLPDAKEQAP